MRGSRCSTRTWPHSAGTCTTQRGTWTGEAGQYRRRTPSSPRARAVFCPRPGTWLSPGRSRSQRPFAVYGPLITGSISPKRPSLRFSTDDGDPLGLGVHEHVEVVAEFLHDRVLLEHRLDREALGLDDLALRRGVRVHRRSHGGLLLLRFRPDPGLRLALDLVHDDVQRRLVRGAGCVALERLAVDDDDERHIHDVCVRRRAVQSFDSSTMASARSSRSRSRW